VSVNSNVDNLNFLTGCLFSQCAGGHVGWHHCWAPDPPEPAGPGLEPDLWSPGGGGDSAAPAGGRSGTNYLFIKIPLW